MTNKELIHNALEQARAELNNALLTALTKAEIALEASFPDSAPIPLPAPSPAPNPVVGGLGQQSVPDSQPIPLPITPPSPVFQGVEPSVAQNMIKGSDGVWTSQLGWTSDIACLQFHLKDGKYGETFDVRFARRAKYPMVGNIKTFRVWMPDFKYPDWYVGQPYAGWTFVYTEKLLVSSETRQAFEYPPPTGEWRDEQWLWTAPSGLEKNDGRLKVTIGGKVVCDLNNLQMDSEDYPGVPTLICIQDDPSNQSFPADSFVQVKNISITRSNG